MNLLDTHVIVWAINDPDRLSPAARRVIIQGEYMISSASLWELITKRDKPNCPVPEPRIWWRRHIASRGVQILSIDATHIEHLDALPPHHKDPFDRILIAQAIAEGFRLVTCDEHIRAYQDAVVVLW